MADLQQKAMATRRKVLGDAHVNRARLPKPPLTRRFRR